MFKRIVYIAILSLVSIGAFAQDSLRIVSLSPIVTKSLILLDAEAELVACTKWCPLAEDKAVVANAIDVNVEQVLRLKPDVVFASTLTSKESINTLQQLGIKVVSMPRMISFESMCNDLLTIAKEIGCQEKAEKEIAADKKRLEALKRTIPEGMKPKVMFQVGIKPVFVAIQNTFMEEFITQVGGVNVYGDLEHGTVTRESVLTRNPDAIFISTMPQESENEQQAWMEYKELSAAQKHQVFLIDQELASSPTVRTYVDVIKIMIDDLYDK